MNSNNAPRMLWDVAFSLMWSIGLLFIALAVPELTYIIPLGAIGLGAVYARHGEGKFYIALFWYGVATYLVSDTFNPLILITVVGLNGYALGRIHQKKMSYSMSVLILTMTGVIATLISTEILRLMSDVVVSTDYAKMLAAYEKEMAALAKAQGGNAVEMVETMMMALELLLPFFVLLASFIGALFMNAISRVMFSRMGIEIAKRNPLKNFEYPPTIIVGMFMLSAVAYAASYGGTTSMELITANVLAVNAYVFAVQGVAVTLRVFERIKWPAFVAWLVLAMLIISNGVLMLGMVGFASILFSGFKSNKDIR